jgi:hypothetical protein
LRSNNRIWFPECYISDNYNRKLVEECNESRFNIVRIHEKKVKVHRAEAAFFSGKK